MKTYLKLLIAFWVISYSYLYPQEESISIVTYYPAPVGVYSEIISDRYYDLENTTYYIDFKSGSNKVTSKVLNLKDNTEKIIGKLSLDTGAGYTLEMDCKDNPADDYNIRCGYIRTRHSNMVLAAESGGRVDIVSGDSLRITTVPRFTDADTSKRGLADESSYDFLKLTYDSGNNRLDLFNSKGKLLLSSDGNRNSKVRIYGDGILGINGEPEILSRIYAEQGRAVHAIYGLSTSNNALTPAVKGLNTNGGCGVRADIVINEVSPSPIEQLKSYTAAIVGYTGDTELRVGDLTPRAAIIGLGIGNAPGVYGYNNSDNPLSSKYGIYAKSVSGPGLYARGEVEIFYPTGLDEFVPAAQFKGHIRPTSNNLYDLGSSNKRWYTIFCYNLDGTRYPIGSQNWPDGDVAEKFLIDDKVETGDVLVIGSDNKLKLSNVESDPRVVGVVSENPTIILNDKLEGGIKIAILGNVYVKVDATKAEIDAGDLLVTGDKPGYAVKARDPKPGTILGKALEPLREGEGRILVAISLM